MKRTDTPDPDDLGKDILRGGREIAKFLFDDEKFVRRVFHLAETSNMPFFKLGSMLCLRRSVMIKWIRDQEGTGEASNDNNIETGVQLQRKKM